MELKNTGNLVLLGNNDSVVMWQSFDYPIDTLLPLQEFNEGMKLVSELDSNKFSYVLEIGSSGDVTLSAVLKTLQPMPYWSMQSNSRKIVNKGSNEVASVTIVENSWRFYDKKKSLLWEFVFEDNQAVNGTWTAVLGSDGIITFSNLQSQGLGGISPTRIPEYSCSSPEPCDRYNLCTSDRKCSCLSILSSRPSCKPGFASPCNLKGAIELVKVEDGLNYFELGFLQPFSRTDLIGCKNSCSENCSCLAMFFQESSRNCFLLDRIGSFEKTNKDSGFVSYIKVSSIVDTDKGDSGNGNKQTIIVVIIVILTLLVISGMIFLGLRYYKKSETLAEPSSQENSEGDNFLENLTGMPICYTYNDLEIATNNFSEKLGQGCFGSVYKGVLQNGTELAVKKLEGIGQGKKEFRAEVSIIGSIHHHHLVRLKGFCAEGTHRLLAYEYMANGSLDKWIFNQNKAEFSLDWDTRFNVALGTAKGLAYLHEDCDSKIVHCDIKPENVLLDEKFNAKVSDFGLAKLMTREQSHVFTTLRGTQGYLAPEWITNYAISEKSDVYSYGMVLLEIICGRKNYDPVKSSEKSYFPYFTFKMMEEGKLRDIIDSDLKPYEDDERLQIAIKVALWCIQEDMNIRPSMTKVVQMLEGLCTVPKPPPRFSALRSNIIHSIPFSKSASEAGTSSSPPSDTNAEAFLHGLQLSGPR
ncbi:hypothetical protein PIB30_061610 [Stylosanthes scabra]|uniref:Protein kinase domain-containing protein n=1 Tax=Stylosanthes scabra TaxID=79078 RepID=A0ABU6XLM7_9FABA|nr:hypothetical protein [Stylosanthes scabra]